MAQENFTTTFVVKETPEKVFTSIIKPQIWWSGEFEGDSRQLNDIFTYRYKDLHYSKQRVTELVPSKRVAWQVLESEISFLQDKDEWTGTTITFDISSKGDGTEVTFTHIGLAPDVECYDTCTNAWTSLVQGSLKRLIETGHVDHIELAAPAH
jgi:hypothetical protein